jgi:hypothetical protein
MTQWLSKFVDQASEFFAHRKGLLPIVGIGLVAVNLVIRLAAPGWLASTDLFLHLGVIIAIFGLMLSWAL